MKRIRLISIFLFLICISSGLYAQYDRYYYFEKGRNNLIEGKYYEAIDNFNTLIKVDSLLYDGYFLRGIAKYNLNDLLGAKSDFDKAIQINPVYTQAYHYRAITLSRMGKAQEAETDYNSAINLRPDNTSIYYSKGITNLIFQKYDEAINDLNLFIKEESRVADAYINRGTAYLMKNDTVRALEDYNRAIMYSPFDATPLIRRARIYAVQNENDKAIKDLNRAITLDSTSSLTFFSRAIIKYSMKDLNGAISDLSKVIELDPFNALSFYNRALIRSQIGDYNNAIDDYTKVTEINPTNVLAFYNRASVSLELKDYNRAINDYSKAIDLYPDFANAYLNRSYVKNILGQTSSAKKDYQIAQQKISKFRSEMNDSTFSIYADTSQQFNRILALDAEFAKKSFENKLEQRRINAMLLPQYRFVYGAEHSNIPLAKQYFFPLLKNFISRDNFAKFELTLMKIDIRENDINVVDSLFNILVKSEAKSDIAFAYFLKSLVLSQQDQYASAIDFLNLAIETDPDNIFYYLNRSVVKSEMIDFISSLDNSLPKLSLESTAVSKQKNINSNTFDYSEPLDDLNKIQSLSSFAYAFYNQALLNCFSDNMTEAIDNFSKAIKQYPYMGEAYYNRGLVFIYMRDTDKGCLDLSKAGELGIEKAYTAIKMLCVRE